MKKRWIVFAIAGLINGASYAMDEVQQLLKKMHTLECDMTGQQTEYCVLTTGPEKLIVNQSSVTIKKQLPGGEFVTIPMLTMQQKAQLNGFLADIWNDAQKVGQRFCVKGSAAVTPRQMPADYVGQWMLVKKEIKAAAEKEGLEEGAECIEEIHTEEVGSMVGKPLDYDGDIISYRNRSKARSGRNVLKENL